MRSVGLTAHGGRENLILEESPRPAPGPGEVLIKVHAAGVNRADILQRRGFYPQPPGSSPVLGLEVSGWIEAVHPSVQTWQPGQKVCALLNGGGYAEFAIAHETCVLEIGDDLDLMHAAGLPEVFITASQILQCGEVAAGKQLAVSAASSGVAIALAQLAKQVGFSVRGISRSPEKYAELKSWFPNVFAIEDLEVESIDVMVDLVGASYAEATLQALRSQGVWICVGLLGGAKLKLDLSKVISKRLHLMGTVLRSLPIREKKALVQAFANVWMPKLMSGQISLLPSIFFDFNDVAAAHELMESNSHLGKIILKL